MNIHQMQREAYENSAAHGFHDDFPESNTPTRLMLIVSELAEALEEHRSGKSISYTLNGKPEGIAAELADAVIRIGDLAQTLGFDLEQAVEEKMKYNSTRPFKHGRKAY